MNCPKCNSPRMIPVDHNIGSTLERTNGCMAINGLSCQICGKWVDVVPEPIIRKIPKLPVAYKAPNIGFNLRAVVNAKFDQIMKMRTAKFSWQKVKDVLDVPCSCKHLGSVVRDEIMSRYTRKNSEKS